MSDYNSNQQEEEGVGSSRGSRSRMTCNLRQAPLECKSDAITPVEMFDRFSASIARSNKKLYLPQKPWNGNKKWLVCYAPVHQYASHICNAHLVKASRKGKGDAAAKRMAKHATQLVLNPPQLHLLGRVSKFEF